MPPTSTDRDRRRLAVAAFAAVALHALAIAALSRIPVLNGSLSGGDGGFAAPGPFRSGGGQGPVSLFVSVAGGSFPQPLDDNSDASSVPERLSPINRAETDSLPESVAAIAGAYSEGVPEGGSVNASGSADGSVTGLGSGTGVGSGTGDEDTTGRENGRFVTWLDGAIRAKLHYPERARARNAEGTVVVSLTVPPDGRTCEASLAESSGDAALDRAALALVRSLFPAKVAPGTSFSAPVRIRFALAPAP